jgi:hypothetical protein
MRAGERGTAVDPNLAQLLVAIARANLAAAEVAVARGSDPTAAIATARGWLDRADKARPNVMTIWFQRARAARHEARFAIQRGQPATAAIAAARAAIDEALRLAPKAQAPWTERAELRLLAGDPAGALEDAVKGIENDGEVARAKLVAAEACLALAAQDRAYVERGRAYLDQAVAIQPAHPRSSALRDAFARLRR